MIVDINQHWVPENLFTDNSLLNRLIRSARSHGEHAVLTTVPGTERKQIVIERPKGYVNLNTTEMRADLKARLKMMDEAKVDKAILRLCVWPEWLDLESCKILNDLMAKTVREHPDRFLGLGFVPPWGDDESLEELDRCINDLGLSGVSCQAHYGNMYLDEEEFRPYFKKINQLGVPVCVHHTLLPVDYQSILKYRNVRAFFGRSITQATAVCRELFSGMFDELPNLKLIHTFIGGAFFAFVNMLLPEKSEIPEELDKFEMVADKVRGYLERNIYFDITQAPPWGRQQLECAVKVLGANHMLFGSSFPVRNEWLLKGVEYVQSLHIGKREKSVILGENAMRLFKIKA